MMTQADKVRASQDPYTKAIALMTWRDSSSPSRVVFHFSDESTLIFRKEYKLEAAS